MCRASHFLVRRESQAASLIKSADILSRGHSSTALPEIICIRGFAVDFVHLFVQVMCK